MKKTLFIIFLAISIFDVVHAQWKLNLNISASLNSVYFVDDLNGWVVGTGKILKTNDGGQTWLMKDVGLSVELTSVKFVNKNLGWAVGTKQQGSQFIGVVYKTTNGGLSWNVIEVANPGWLTSCSFIDEFTGWVTDVDGKIHKTINGGTEWQVIETGSDNILNGVCFVDNKNGWVVGNGGDILHSADGGITWEKQSFGTDYRFNSIFFVNPCVGFAVGGTLSPYGYSGIIFKTTDGGAYWKNLNSHLFINAQSVYFINDKLGYCVGEPYGIFKTTNGGYSWEAFYPVPIPVGFPYNFNDVYFSDQDHGWAVGEGYIFSTDIVNSAIFTNNEVSVPAPLLQQNFPNPCSDITTICFSIKSATKVGLTIYSLSGASINKIVDQEFKPGDYQFTMDLKTYQAGIYYYSLVTDSFAETKKMVIVR